MMGKKEYAGIIFLHVITIRTRCNPALVFSDLMFPTQSTTCMFKMIVALEVILYGSLSNNSQEPLLRQHNNIKREMLSQLYAVT